MITILLATYNGERYIEKSINSIINQTYDDWKLLIGFNGTTDSSKEIVNKFNDPRIKIFDYNDDIGKSKTLNKLLNEVDTDWVGIQDDDDVWFNEKLEQQIKYIEDFDVIGTQINYINEFDEYIGGPNLSLDDIDIKHKSFNGDNQMANTSSIFKTSCAKNINGWSENIDGIEDFDFWLRLMRNDYKFKNLDIPLVNHRLHNKSNFNTNSYDITKIL